MPCEVGQSPPCYAPTEAPAACVPAATPAPPAPLPTTKPVGTDDSLGGGDSAAVECPPGTHPGPQPVEVPCGEGQTPPCYEPDGAHMPPCVPDATPHPTPAPPPKCPPGFVPYAGPEEVECPPGKHPPCYEPGAPKHGECVPKPTPAPTPSCPEGEVYSPKPVAVPCPRDQSGKCYSHCRKKPPSASGDPHCVNIRGQQFDIYAVGPQYMVALPGKGAVRGRDLTVVAEIAKVTTYRCSPMIIKKVIVRGDWLGGPAFTFSPSARGYPAIGAPVTANSRDWKDKPDVHLKVIEPAGRVELSVGKIKIAVMQRHGRHTGIDYLDMRVIGLSNLVNTTVGGLLGLDPHFQEATPPRGCKAQTVKLARSTTHRRLDNLGENLGRLVSSAFAS